MRPGTASPRVEHDTRPDIASTAAAAAASVFTIDAMSNVQLTTIYVNKNVLVLYILAFVVLFLLSLACILLYLMYCIVVCLLSVSV